MLFKRVDASLSHGTSGSSIYVYVAPSILVARLGEPDESDGFKVSGEYTFKAPNGGIITLYDWKCTSLYDPDAESPENFWRSQDTREFNIGGDDKGKEMVSSFINYIQSLSYNSVDFIMRD